MAGVDLPVRALRGRRVRLGRCSSAAASRCWCRELRKARRRRARPHAGADGDRARGATAPRALSRARGRNRCAPTGVASSLGRVPRRARSSPPRSWSPACAERPGGAPRPTSPASGNWPRGRADGAALPRPPGRRATLDVGADSLSGRRFCNHYSSTYRLDGDALVVDGLGGTEMACEPEVMAAETRLPDARSARADTVGGRGRRPACSPGTASELRFTPVPPVPDSALAGTRWVLETLVEGEAASSTLGEPAVLLLDADRTCLGVHRLPGGDRHVAARERRPGDRRPARRRRLPGRRRARRTST